MKTRALARITSFSLFAVVLALLVALGSGTAHAAGSFSLLSEICLDDQTTVDPDLTIPGHAGECDGSSAAGANVALTNRFGVGLGPDAKIYSQDDAPDYNFGAIVSFTPPAWGVAKASDVPIGAVAGQLQSKATLGILDVNPCRSQVNVPFEFLNASIDPGKPVYPLPSGTENRLKPLAEDSDGNGIPDGADKWPEYLTEVFEEADLSGLRARLIGFNDEQAVSDLTIVLNFVIFEPGTKLTDEFTPDPCLGYPSVTVLQDTTEAASADDPVNDFCSPLLSANSTYGVTKDNPLTAANEGNKPYRTNPPDGAYSFLTFAARLPDADGDGIENGLDPCPFTADPTTGEFQWNPRMEEDLYFAAPGVPDDKDGLPYSCDPNPFEREVVGTCCDQDHDFWRNRSDNCPLVSNPDNNDEDSDGIGDTCDVVGAEITFPDGSKGSGLGPDDIDGRVEGIGNDAFDTCKVTVIEIGAGGTPLIAAGVYQPCNPNALLPAGGCGAAGAGGAADGGAGDGDGAAAGDAAVAGETGGPADAAGGAAGGAATGVGSLAPIASSIPAWAAIASALGGAGLLGSLGALAARFVRRRR